MTTLQLVGSIIAVAVQRPARAQSSPSGPIRVALIYLSLLASFQVSAQEIPAPGLNQGDAWTYKYSLDGAYQWDYTESVQSIDGSTAEFLVTDTRGRSHIVTFDVPTHRYLTFFAVSRVDGRRGRVLRDETDNSAPIKFPFSVGAEWSVVYKFVVNGDPITQQFHAEVVGHELIHVPAGDFDAYKIEFKGFWQNDNGIGFGAKARQMETYWFAPAVKRFVRREIKSYGISLVHMTAAVTYWRVDELVRFTAGGVKKASPVKRTANEPNGRRQACRCGPRMGTAA